MTSPVTATTVTRAVLLAHPVAHSASPAMHDAAFAALGLDGRYEAWDVPPAEVPSALARLRAARELFGANVSVPHKLAVLPLLDELSADAHRLGAVNTIVRRDQRLVGHNTDAEGLAAALAELRRRPGAGHAVLLGAGGAARAALAVFLAAGASVAIHNRSRERAEELVHAWRAVGDVSFVSAEGLAAAVAGADWLVNATSVGMPGGTPGNPVPGGVLPERGAVVDLVYGPSPTPLVSAARAAGLETQDGRAMLVHQGAAAFTLWTGHQAPVDVMREALDRALSARAA